LDTIQGNSPTAFHPDTGFQPINSPHIEMVKLVLAGH